MINCYRFKYCAVPESIVQHAGIALVWIVRFKACIGALYLRCDMYGIVTIKQDRVHAISTWIEHLVINETDDDTETQIQMTRNTLIQGYDQQCVTDKTTSLTFLVLVH